MSQERSRSGAVVLQFPLSRRARARLARVHRRSRDFFAAFDELERARSTAQRHAFYSTTLTALLVVSLQIASRV